MYIYAYLRASTAEQDAGRARKPLERFAADHGLTVAAWFVETASGASLARPELMRLLADVPAGSCILIEQVDRLTRLDDAGWEKLKGMVTNKELRIVSLDLPISFNQLKAANGGILDDFTAALMKSFNLMMMDVLAAVARKDYEDRRRRQAQGIEKAKADGKFKGRPINEEKHAEMRRLRAAGLSIQDVAKVVGVSVRTVTRVTKTS